MNPLLVRLGLFALVLGAYAPSLDGDFLWDDRPLILDDPGVQSVRHALAAFVSPFWDARPDRAATLAFYRPLVVLSYAVEMALHGPNAAAFHAVNVLLHALNVQLLFTLLRRESQNVAVAGAFAAAWAVFPRLAECTAWIAGRTDVLAATFALAALLLAKEGKALAAVAMLTAGIFSKEVTLAAIAVLAVEAVRGGQRRRAVLFLSPLALYLPLRRVALGAVSASGIARHGGGRAVLVPFEALGRYAQALALPWLPDAQQGDALVVVPGYVALGAVVVGALGAWALSGRGRATLGKLAGPAVLFAVSLGLVLHLLPLAADVVAADRYLYFPSIGLAWAAVRTWPTLRAPRVAAVLAVSFVPFTVRAASLWGDEVAFWAAVRRAHPHSPRGPLELGNVAFRAALYEPAMQLAEEGLRLAPGTTAQTMAATNLASCAVMVGDYARATRLFGALAEADPARADTRLMLAYAAVHRGAFDEARRDAEAALRLHTPYPEATDLLARLPGLSAAAAAGATGVERARLEEALGRRVEAVAEWRRWVFAADAPPDARLEGAAYLVARGEVALAEEAAAAVAPLASPAVAEALQARAHERAALRQRLATILDAP